MLESFQSTLNTVLNSSLVQSRFIHRILPVKRFNLKTSFYSTSSYKPSFTPSLKARFNPWPAMSNWSAVLETYARYTNPKDQLAEGIYLASDDKTLTIFDGYEKAKYHFLIMPRGSFPLNGTSSKIPSLHLKSLSQLLKSPYRLEVLEALKSAGEKVKVMIEDEMQKSEGFVWDIQIGFHGAESMTHVHLHVISSDLISPKLKNKKHYNSFNPKLGFFLPLSDIIDKVKNDTLNQPSTSHFESLLKGPLISFYNDEEYKNIPKLKEHLVSEWEKLRRKGRKEIEVAAEKKRKLEEGEMEEAKKKLKEV